MGTFYDKWKTLATIAFPVVTGTVVGVFANKSSRETYQKLKTPEFAPSGWVFPTAWTTLYTSVGIAKYKFNRSKKTQGTQNIGDVVYAAQLSLNYLWSFFFFKWQLRGTALLDAILLWLSVLINGLYFYQSNKQAGLFFIPYATWTAFAFFLNYSTWQLNRPQQITSNL